jgi:hypothetical protein
MLSGSGVQTSDLAADTASESEDLVERVAQ